MNYFSIFVFGCTVVFVLCAIFYLGKFNRKINKEIDELKKLFK